MGSPESCSAVVSVDLPSHSFAEIVSRSIEPETRVSVGFKSKVQVGIKGLTLVLCFETEDTSALRAVVNSYLRWVAMLVEALGCLSASPLEV